MTLLFRPSFQFHERRVKSARHIPTKKKKGEVPPGGLTQSKQMGISLKLFPRTQTIYKEVAMMDSYRSLYTHLVVDIQIRIKIHVGDCCISKQSELQFDYRQIVSSINFANSIDLAIIHLFEIKRTDHLLWI